MELKPSRDKMKLDGFGRPLGKSDTKNPFASIARGMEAGLGPGLGQLPSPQQGSKRRRIGADTLGATPPRDGPWAIPAADVAVAKPPRARSRQQRIANAPGMSLTKGQRL